MVHIALKEKRVATTKNKSYLHFWRNFTANQIQANPNPHQKKLKRIQIWKKPIRFRLADDLSNIFIFQIISFKTIYCQPNRLNQLKENHDLLSLQRRNLVDSRFWARLCYSYSKWSRSKYNNQLTKYP